MELDSVVGPSLEVVPFEISPFLNAEGDGGSSPDFSIEGKEDGQLFDLGGNMSSEEEAGFPLVPQWSRHDCPVPPS